MGELMRRPASMTAKNALLWGMFWLIGGAIIEWYFTLVPTSIVGYTLGGSYNLIDCVIYGVAIWVALALPTLLIVWFAGRGVAAWEVFGRMLFAHMPITLLMLPAMLGDNVDYAIFMGSPLSARLSIGYVVLMLIYVVAIGVWYLYWSFVAFRRVTQFSGLRGVMMFVGAIATSYLLSVYAIDALMKM